MHISINERINELYLNSGEKSIRRYALSINVAPTTLNECIKGSEPRFSLLSAILNGNPSISAEWLMRGKGEMFLNDQKEEALTFDENFYKDIIRDYQKMVEDLQKKNARLKEIVSEFSQKAKTA